MKTLQRIKTVMDRYKNEQPNFASEAFRDLLAEQVYAAVMKQDDSVSSTYNTNQLELFSFKDDAENK